MIPMKLPDILDRLSICILKQLRTKEDQTEEILEYLRELQGSDNAGYLIALLDANKTTWDLEADIRASVDLPIIEVGELAVLVRENNKKRVAIKNQIVEATGQGYKDVKVNYIGTEK